MACRASRTPWRKVLDWKPPRAKWFVGGTLNASVNRVDGHVAGPRRKAAIVWEGEPERRVSEPAATTL